MTTATDDRPQRAAFVLSGGGSLGAVQVGMLQALGGAGVEPDLLVGTSAGAVNATWVAGHGMSGESLAELARLWRGLRRRELFPVHPERVLGALLGLSHAVSSSDRLGELAREHAGFGDLADAAVETHLIATDLLTGHPVLLTRGPVDTAVRASAAVPGLYPPVLIDGRHLVDGGVAQHAGLEDAVRLGATTIWVLPTGYPCALTRPPRSAIGIALQALTLLTEQRLITEVAASAPSVTVKVLPPLCPLAVSAADFSHARELIARARRATTRWLAEGGPDLPTPERFLALHHHPHQLPLQHPDAVGRGASGASLETLGGKVAGFRGSVAGDCPSRDAWNGGGRGRRPVRTEVTTVASCPRRRWTPVEGDTMSTDEFDGFAPLTADELASEGITALPDKEVISILDLAADVDLAIDGAAPIDLAVALNANVVAPIDAAVSANLLSDGSQAQAVSNQGVQLTQTIDADAIATGVQESTIDQSDTVEGDAPASGTESGSMLNATTGTGDPAGAPADAAADSAAAAASAPVDGSVVVDSAGNIIGTLDSATGNVVAPDGAILGTLNETTGVVVDSAGNLIGTVTDLVDGATVAGSGGAVLGVLDAATGNVLDASGNVVGTLDPLTGDVLNTAGSVIGTVTDLVDGTTVLDSAGNVVGTLDGATGNVVNSVGTVIGSLNPLTGQVLDAAGNLVGTVGQVLDDVTDTVNQLDTGDLLKGDLLNVDVNVDLDADLAAPINGAVAANANIAAPIDASVAANILSDDSVAVAMANQDVNITQTVTGNAEATSEQVSDINQGSVEPVDTDTASADDTAAASPTVEPAPADAPATEEPAPAAAPVAEEPAPAAAPATQPATQPTTQPTTEPAATDDGTVASSDSAGQ